MSDSCKGSCLCGSVAYEISGNIGVFQYCHCSRCRKFTGSAHSANLFVKPEQFRWLKGEDSVGTFEPDESKYFTTAFCRRCGSSLPWTIKTGKTVVVTAGTLDDPPDIKPSQNIYCGSRAAWYVAASSLPENDTLPSR